MLRQRERREFAVAAQEWAQRLRRRDEGGQARVLQPKPQPLLAELGAQHRDAQVLGDHPLFDERTQKKVRGVRPVVEGELRGIKERVGAAPRPRERPA